MPVHMWVSSGNFFGGGGFRLVKLFVVPGTVAISTVFRTFNMIMAVLRVSKQIFICELPIELVNSNLANRLVYLAVETFRKGSYYLCCPLCSSKLTLLIVQLNFLGRQYFVRTICLVYTLCSG